MNRNTILHITSVHTRYDIRIFIKECISLQQNGYKVSLMVADSKGDEIKNEINIIDIGKPKGRLGRMLKTTNIMYHQIIKLNPKVIHFHDPELMLVGLKLTKAGYKVIYDVHEDLPKQVTNKHWIPRVFRPIISKLVSQLEKKCAKQFNGIVTATPIIAERFSKYNSNVVSICNYPKLIELSNINVEWHNRKLDLCYIGSISKTRGIEPLIASLELSKLNLELAGMFSGDVSLSSLLPQSGYEYVNYHGILNREQIIQLLSQVKIGLVTLLPTPSYVESLPIKLFEYMLAGIPVVASNFKMWADIILRYNCGILVNPNNPQEIANACQTLLNNPQLAKQLGGNGKSAVLEHYNWDIEQLHLANFYKKLL
ncbi:MAG: glycosyltransferase family 4 protein [Burkholderiales bacterium]|nr:glycosyltransferase family 4 protein [Burkholderiales bacterium]